MQLTDTHCHLDMDRFDQDRDEMIARAVEAGVGRMLVPGLEIGSSKAVIALAEKHDQVYAAVGVHPNSGNTWQEGTLKILEELAQHPRVCAIGEIGLDYHWDTTPRYKQEGVFHYQLDLAAKLGLPVVIHSREAEHDIVRKLVEWQKQLAKRRLPLAEKPGVLHSYSGNIELAQQALEANFYLGFTGPVTFKKAKSLREVIAQVPLNRVLIETDAPFLTPHPHRGKRNEPVYVRHVAEKIAELHGLALDEIAQQTTANAAELFEW